MTTLHNQDGDLHLSNGQHRKRPAPSTLNYGSPDAVRERFKRRLERHLIAHEMQAPRKARRLRVDEAPPMLTGRLDMAEIETAVRRPLGRQIANLIYQQGLTQQAVADHLGIVKGTLEARLSGRLVFTVAELVYLSRLLDVPIAELLWFGGGQ